MANKTQPIKTLRAGRIQAAIWENHSDKGPFYNVTVSRSYKDGMLEVIRLVWQR